MALVSTFKSLQPAKAVALIWIFKSSQLGQCPAQRWVSMRGWHHDMFNIEISNAFSFRFHWAAEQTGWSLPQIRNWWGKIREISLKWHKIAFFRPRAASCMWPVSPATWPSITRMAPWPRRSTPSWGRTFSLMLTVNIYNINKFQNHCHSWEQLPLWRWQVSSGRDIFLQNWLNTWRMASFFRTFCKPLKQAPVGSHAITSENSAERIR